MGSKRPATSSNYNYNSRLYPNPTLPSVNAGSSTTGDPAKARLISTSLLSRGKPFNSVQAATTQSRSRLFASSSLLQPGTSAQDPSQVASTAAVAAHMPCKNPEDHDPSFDVRSWSDFALTVKTILEKNLQVMGDGLESRLASHFNSLHAEIDSIRKFLKDEVPKVKEELRDVAEAQRMNHASYTGALKDAGDKITILEARLGRSQLEHEGNCTKTVIDRLDEICLTLGEFAEREKTTDPEADVVSKAMSPSPLRPGRSEIGVSPLSPALISQSTDPKAPVPRFFPATQVRTIPGPSRIDTQSTSWQIQTIEIDSPESEKGAPVPDTNLPYTQESSFFTSSPKVHTTNEQPRTECSISPIPRKPSETLHGFSKVDWNQEAERRSTPVTPIYQPPPISSSCRLSQSPSLRGVGSLQGRTRSKEPSPLSQYEVGSGSQDQDQDQSQNQSQKHVSELAADVALCPLAATSSPALTDRGLIPDLEYPTRETTVAINDASPRASQGKKHDSAGNDEMLDEAEFLGSPIPPDSLLSPVRGDRSAAPSVGVPPSPEITITRGAPPVVSSLSDGGSLSPSPVPERLSLAPVLVSPMAEQESQQGTEREVQRVPKPMSSKRKMPLFFPDSRMTTPFLHGDNSSFVTEKTEEGEVSQSLLLQPERERTPISPPADRRTPIVDVSQFTPPYSQDQSPLNTPKPRVNLSTEGEPKGSAASGRDPSSADASHVFAELATLSEPLSPCSSLSEIESDEPEVDELLSDSEASEARSAHRLESETEGEENTEDIRESFTPKPTATVESAIQSYGTLTDALKALKSNSPIQSVGSRQESPVVRRKGLKERVSLAKSGDRTATGSTETISSLPSAPSLLGLARVENAVKEAFVVPLVSVPSSHLDSQTESEPLAGLSPSASPVFETRTRDIPREAPVIPMALPSYISPVNSPPPSPLPTRLGKRKLEEIKGGVQASCAKPKASEAQNRVPQAERQGQTVVETPTRRPMRVMKTSNSGPQLQPLSSVRRREVAAATTPARSSQHQPSSVDVSARGEKGQKRPRRSEVEEGGSPIYISSQLPTPTEEAGKEVECIDLTNDSPVAARTMVQDKAPSTLEKRRMTRCIKAAPRQKGKGQGDDKREKEAREEQDREEKGRKNKEEQRQLREKKEKEKKLLPIGAEDSDDAEVIPAKSFKEPLLRLDTGEGEEEGNATSTPNKAGLGPTGRENISRRVDFRSLMAASGKESRAVTKVKKRGRLSAPTANVNEDNIVDGEETGKNTEDEPPLKRARRLHSGDLESTPSAASSKNLESRRSPRKLKEDKTKDDTEKEVENIDRDGGGRRRREAQKLSVGMVSPSSVVRIKWPVKEHGDRTYQKNFIECDMCYAWYHYGCVGIQLNDVRLKDSELFACPPCGAGRYQDTSIADDREKSPRDTCNRPDCGFKSTPTDQNEFFVKRIVGRRCRVEGGRGRVEEWLVEWDGYPISEATWEKDTSMANPDKLIENFVAATEEEGLDLDQDPNATVLLKDAQKNGWKA